MGSCGSKANMEKIIEKTEKSHISHWAHDPEVPISGDVGNKVPYVIIGGCRMSS